MSLWDILTRFGIGNFWELLDNLAVIEHVGQTLSSANKGSVIDQRITGDLKQLADRARLFCQVVGFDEAHGAAEILFRKLAGDADRFNVSHLEVEARHLREVLIKETCVRAFVSTTKEHAAYVDSISLFGAEVDNAFPSGSLDIREAGNCLAVGCGTAAVFHLMRASEFSLRALARDRDVSFKDKPLEEKEWGQILGALETKVGNLRSAAATLWPLREARDVQIRFYDEVVQELRSFNGAWRRHVSHADIHAFYEPHDAVALFLHVRRFMQKLSEKISESSQTPEYWDSL